MEGQFGVDFSFPNPQQERESSFPTVDPQNPASWQFVTDFNHLVDGPIEPDALFFVESWTLGAQVAIENLKQRNRVNAVQYEEHVETLRNSASGLEERIVADIFTAEDFMRQQQMQFCSSRYGAPKADGPTSFGVLPESKAEPESPAEEIDFDEQLEQPMTRQRAMQILGVSAASSRIQIKSAYRRLVNEWHPDRFEWRTSRAQSVATEKMTLINKAYQLLQKAA